MTETLAVSRRSWSWRLILFGLAFGVGGATLAMSVSPQVGKLRHPAPNGYDELVKAGSLRQGDWPHNGDLAKATVEEIRPFVEANRKALDQARLGLALECMVPIDDTQAGLNLHLDAINSIRDVARLLDLQARVMIADGRISEAVAVYRDSLELGQVVTQGGMASDGQLGWVLQEQAIRRLRAIRHQIPAEEIRKLLVDLDRLDHRRVSLQALEDRWARWYQGAFSPATRGMMRVNGVEKKSQTDQAAFAKKGRDRIERAMRYFQIELAIHLFHEDRQVWPRSVEELVPKYLPAVPVDSNTGESLDYPTNAAGELTDDVSAIARPDGQSVKPKP